MSATSPALSPTVDESNPWIGLASFTEETRDYFHGREDEVAELARRVQRKLLTVLFGQSGLGKTSILRAGLVPRLRAQGYCPVYVRVDYSRESPDPAEQIKQIIAQTAERFGQWTRAGVATEGESLWEFLHHRDDVLLDDTGKALIPLLIFDQFEEVFTVAQADDFGRARAARFIADLADLVENRPPAALEARLEADETTAERFDFARSDYRVLIALREDYLAPLESLKTTMPSVTQNRLRLARMTGTQGLAAVLRPGKGLVTEEVAAAIVSFVAGGAAVQNAEVEPSLLSLICRELNDTRLAQNQSAISLDLLAGSHATILSNFYERALADQPAAARRIIEDELLTDSGFRENIAEERLKRSFANAGVSPDALSTLVNRRLLRIEERLDVRRVELTHDVLCGVVKSSRDIRQEREAREAAERLLAEQQEREATSRRALIKARQVATICIVLAIGAVAAAIYAYWSTQRAQRAEGLAQQSRLQAEQLLGYLTDDFARELESFGRLDIVAGLTQREIDYFRALPEELKGPTTVRIGAIAMTQFARASRRMGKIDDARAAVTEAQRLLEGLRNGGDTSNETTIALARALSLQGRIVSMVNDSNALTLSQRAVDLLAPLVAAPDASLAVREAEVDLLLQLGFQQQTTTPDYDTSIATLQRTMKLAEALGARDLTNLPMAERYVEAGGWIVQAFVNAGRIEPARRMAEDSVAIADKILAVRPNDTNALYALSVIQTSLTFAAMDAMRPAEALEQGAKGVAAQERLVALDPDNTVTKNNLAIARSALVDANWSLGRTEQALDYLRQSIADSQDVTRASTGLRLGRLRQMLDLGYRNLQAGKVEVAVTAADELAREAAEMRSGLPKESLLPVWAEAFEHCLNAHIALVRGDPEAAARIAHQALIPVDAATPRPGNDQTWQTNNRFLLNNVASRAEFMRGDYIASERSARAALAARQIVSHDGPFDWQEMDAESLVVSLSLAGQQRVEEAREMLGPVVKRRRDAQSANHGDNDVQLALAIALYAQAQVDPPRRVALLKESDALMNSLVSDYKRIRYVQYWRQRLTDAMR